MHGFQIVGYGSSDAVGINFEAMDEQSVEEFSAPFRYPTAASFASHCGARF